ncbi:MAG: PhnD/SsuA/transferrin family substrate-binding protein [Myxococcales bacterium]|nr:PhnD/SsuA/transferrin family substrate-binding protein [Myxococcales bacterium]
MVLSQRPPFVYFRRRLRRVLVGASLAVLLAPALAWAKPLGFAVIDPELERGGAASSSQIDALMRRMESAAGLPAGTLRGQGFNSFESAEAQLAKGQVAFALAPAYAFAKLWKRGGVQVMGYAGGLDPKAKTYKLVARSADPVGPAIHQHPGLRLATKERDLQWLNVVFDGLLNPTRHFREIVQTQSEAEALDAVEAGKADVALVWAEHLSRHKAQVGTNRPLRIAYTSGEFPPPALLTLRGRAPGKLVKALTKALPEVCKGQDHIDVCADLGFFSLVVGPHELHPHAAYKYDKYKM